MKFLTGLSLGILALTATDAAILLAYPAALFLILGVGLLPFGLLESLSDEEAR